MNKLIIFTCLLIINSKLIAVDPTEIYGPTNAEVALVLGNGGAGPTCLLQELSENFIQLNHLDIRIGWIQTISRFTLENLKAKVIDISLTYDKQPELLAVQEGWASNRTLIFNDHFILVGPKNNPAGILPTDTIELAFHKIAQSESSFFSRDDLSGSNKREQLIWQALGLEPWKTKPEWYVAQQVFPVQALKKSDMEGHYTVTDRGTLIASKDELKNMAVYVQNGKTLMNRCHVLLQDEPSELAEQFLDYLKSDQAQNIIAHYAGKKMKNCVDCCPLFTPAKRDEFLQPACLEKLGFSPQPK